MLKGSSIFTGESGGEFGDHVWAARGEKRIGRYWLTRQVSETSSSRRFADVAHEHDIKTMETTDLHLPEREKEALDQLKSWATWGGWVVLDTETTGLDGHVIEISVLTAGGEVLIDTLVQSEHKSLTEEARGIHGITEEDLADAPRWEKVWPELRRVVTGKEVLAYNAQFDAERITETLQDHDIIGDLDGYMGSAFPWPHAVNCIMAPYIRARSRWDDEKERYDWISLEDAAQKEDVKIDETLHRARADADLARRLVLSFADEAVTA